MGLPAAVHGSLNGRQVTGSTPLDTHYPFARSSTMQSYPARVAFIPSFTCSRSTPPLSTAYSIFYRLVDRVGKFCLSYNVKAWAMKNDLLVDIAILKQYTKHISEVRNQSLYRKNYKYKTRCVEIFYIK